MKKFLLSLLCVAGFVAANAENPKALTGTKFLDNWSIGVNAGVTQPLAHPYSIDSNIRGLFGVELYKQFTPVFKAGAEINFGVNTTGVYGVRGVRTAFDTHNLSLNGGLNLMNLFGGYKGTPRLFEIEAIGGIGWGHMYTNYEVDGPAYNYMTTKFGVNFNFNLGKDKAWTLGIKPAIVYDIEGRTSNNGVKFDTNYANVELQARPATVHTTSYMKISTTKHKSMTSTARLTNSVQTSTQKTVNLARLTSASATSKRLSKNAKTRNRL